jgi:hypothetical protein
MAGIDHRHHNAADHIRRYLTTVRDHRVSDRFLALGIIDAKILEQRLRDMELGQRKIQGIQPNRSTDERRSRSESNFRRSQAYRAAPVREVRWIDQDDQHQAYFNEYEYEEQSYEDYEDSYTRIYSAEDRPRPLMPRGGEQRRRDDGYSSYRPRQFQDLSAMECKDCGRPGHPTDRCLYRCKGCHKVHQEGACPLPVQLITLAQQLRKTQGDTALPQEVQDILKGLNC